MEDINPPPPQLPGETKRKRGVVIAQSPELEQFDARGVDPCFKFSTSFEHANGGLESRRIQLIAKVDNAIFQAACLQAEHHVHYFERLVGHYFKLLDTTSATVAWRHR